MLQSPIVDCHTAGPPPPPAPAPASSAVNFDCTSPLAGPSTSGCFAHLKMHSAVEKGNLKMHSGEKSYYIKCSSAVDWLSSCCVLFNRFLRLAEPRLCSHRSFQSIWICLILKQLFAENSDIAIGIYNNRLFHQNIWGKYHLWKTGVLYRCASISWYSVKVIPKRKHCIVLFELPDLAELCLVGWAAFEWYCCSDCYVVGLIFLSAADLEWWSKDCLSELKIHLQILCAASVRSPQ